MNKLMTLNLRVTKQLRIDQILNISQVAKSYEGNIYLLTKSKNVINTAKFTALITYFLTVKNGQTLNLIIDGPSPQLKLMEIEEIFSAAIIKQRVQVLQHDLKVKL